MYMYVTIYIFIATTNQFIQKLVMSMNFSVYTVQ